MSTTPEGVTQNLGKPPSAARNQAPDDHTMAAQFQGLFDDGLKNEGATDPERFERADKANEQPQREIPAPQKAQETPVPEKGPEDGDEEYDSLEAFLSAQKLDPEQFQSLPVTVKVDGQERAVPLVDVIKAYQLDAHVTQKSQAVAEAQKQFETERTAAIELYRQQLGNAKALGDLAQAQLMGEFNQVNWTELRATDPAMWVVRQQEFQNRAAAINQHLQQVAAATEAQSAELRQQQAALLPKERDKMLEAIPEWKDQAKFEADRKVMSSYAKNLGFSDAELAAVYDHRYMQVLHDAASYRALQAQNPETLKRVRAAPQMAKPGTRTSRDPQAVAKQQAMERFNKNPRDLAAQQAFFETLL